MAKPGMFKRVWDAIWNVPSGQSPLPKSRDVVAPNATSSTTPPESTIPEKVVQHPIIKPAVLAWARTQPKYSRLKDGEFEEHAYDFTEIIRAEDTEMYIAKAFQEYTQLVLREGFAVKGTDQRVVDYINKRLFEIQLLTNYSTSYVMRRVAQDLIKFSNAFVVFTRETETKKVTSGKTYRYNGRMQRPITGFFVADPTTTKVKRDINGRPLAYKQYIPMTGSTRVWSPDQVVHFTYNQKSGMGYGTPWIVASLDDVRMLRRLEEYVDMLCGIYALPLWHVQVGTEKHPAGIDPATGLSEVDIAKTLVERMPTEGCFVSDHRHKIEIAGADGAAIDLSKYIDHFKNRVIAGVGMSGVALGEGGTANRGTATQMIQVAVNRCKDIQEVIADVFTSHILIQLFLDGQFPLKPSTVPYLEFAEVDLEEQRAMENHAADMFNNSLFSHSEARTMMNRNAMSDQEMEDDVIARNKKREMEMQSQFDVTRERAKAASKTQTGKTSVAAKNRPSNQSGTKATKTKVRKNDTVSHIKLETKALRTMFASQGRAQLDEGSVRKSVDFYLDKVYHVVDTFIRKSVNDIAEENGWRAIDDEQMAELIQTQRDSHLNGSVTHHVDQIHATRPYEDKDRICGILNSLEGLFVSAVDKIDTEISEILSEVQVDV